MRTDQIVLIAEDNPDDALLLRRAIEKAGIRATVRILPDGEEVLLYLQGTGAYADRIANPAPSLMILDLKMPRKGGFEVLEWIGDHPEYYVVPTIVMSASMIDEDIRRAYRLGANSYFVKPGSLGELVETLKSIKEYWERARTVRPGTGPPQE